MLQILAAAWRLSCSSGSWSGSLAARYWDAVSVVRHDMVHQDNKTVPKCNLVQFEARGSRGVWLARLRPMVKIVSMAPRCGLGLSSGERLGVGGDSIDLGERVLGQW